jgi:nucleotide-binding universal stress UspA family protein
MRTVLAALDASAAARPVLETALGLGRLTGANVEAVHVGDGSVETPATLAARRDVPYRLLDGPVEPALLDAVDDPAVIAAVLGARGTPAGRRPAGRTALHVMERADKPVVVVPPNVAARGPWTFHRLLVPLEGSEQSSRPVAEGLSPLINAEIEVIVLHVFTAETMPRILDRPLRDLELWGDEFLARYGPSGAHIECRTGQVGDQVAQVCRDELVDLVVLSWSRDASAGHAAVITEVLSRSTVPVLLLPVLPPATTPPRR